MRSIPTVLIAGLAACAPQPAAFPEPLTDTERAAVGDTIRQLYLESSRTFDSDLDCAEIVDRVAPGGETGSWVAQGRLFEMSGGRDELVSVCRAIKRDRLSAREEVRGATVELLGRDAAVLIAPGAYTIRFRDGRVTTRQQVVTTVWARRPQGWRRVHLHESWQEE